MFYRCMRRNWNVQGLSGGCEVDYLRLFSNAVQRKMKERKQRKRPSAMASSSSATGAAASCAVENEHSEENSLTGLLTDDTLLQIMLRLSTRELLSSVAFVCHRWRRLCQSFAVYELVPSPLSPSRNPWYNMGRKQLLQLAVSHASTVQRMHLHGLRRFKSEEVIALCCSLPKLQDLAIISCPNIETLDLELIISQLPKDLIRLDIHDDVNPVPCLIDDAILANIYQTCPRLRTLDLDTSSEITRHGLDGLLQACTSLTSLDLSSPLLGWPAVAQVFKSCKSLCHFSLVSPLLVPDNEDDGFAGGFKTGRGASKELERNVFGSEVLYLGQEMPKHLTSIRLYASPHHSVPFENPPMLGLLRSNGHQLRQLHAKGVYNTSWKTISVWCSNLRVLDLTHNGQHSHSLILTPLEEMVLCELIQLLKKLERIALPSATDHILTTLGRFCPNLKEIRFLDTYLENTTVSDWSVMAVAEGCPALKVLSLSGCPKLTISSARSLAFHCGQLEVLILNRCVNFNDDAVAAMLPALSKSLVLLDLAGCQITQRTLEAIQRCAKVTTLRVVVIGRALYYRTMSMIMDIHSRNPRLRIRENSGIFWDGFYHGTTVD